MHSPACFRGPDLYSSHGTFRQVLIQTSSTPDADADPVPAVTPGPGEAEDHDAPAGVLERILADATRAMILRRMQSETAEFAVHPAEPGPGADPEDSGPET